MTGRTDSRYLIALPSLKSPHREGELLPAVDRLRANIGERRREGCISRAYVRQLDAAAAALAPART